MWKQILEATKQLISLTRDVQKSKEDIKEAQQARKEDRQEIKELNEKVDRLTEIVQRLAFELKLHNERSETDRKMLLLEAENMILRYGRSLPPADKQDDEEPKQEK